MDIEMSSQPHLLICCYLLSSRQYSVHRHTQCWSQHNIHHIDIRAHTACCHCCSNSLDWTGGYAELPISFQVLVQISELQQLKKGAGAWLPVNGMHSCEKGRCRDPQSEHLWKNILIVLLLRQVMWSKCPATQKHVPGKSECSYWRWLRSLQSRAWKQKPQCLCIIMCYVLYKHPVKIFPTQESFHFSGRSQ